MENMDVIQHFTESLKNQNEVIIVIYSVGVYLFLFTSIKFVFTLWNTTRRYYTTSLTTSWPTVHVDKTLKVSVRSITLNQYSLDAINVLLHYNCQFEKFSIDEINIRLFPYIYVEVCGITFKGFALPPSQWSKEGVIVALEANRLDNLDDITRRLYKILYRKFKITKYVENFLKSLFLKVLHLIDILIGTVYCDIRNVSASFCAIRKFEPNDVAVLAHIGHIEVRPSSGFRMALSSAMFKMAVRLEDVSLTSRYVSNNELVAPPMLAPVSVEGYVTLPKILSQMIRTEALPTKTCHLDLKTSHVFVDLGRINTAGLLNFSLAIIHYRRWYGAVMSHYEKTLEVATSPDIDPQTALTNYVALYSNYAQSAGYNIHIDRSKSIFGFISDEKDPTVVLRNKCRKYEAYMSSAEIINARVLALGWKEKKDMFSHRLEVIWSDSDGDFFKTMQQLYDREGFSHKEIRNIKVTVKADQVDFFLSTPRTIETPLHISMTNYLKNTSLPGRGAGSSPGKNSNRFAKQAEIAPPVMLSVCGIYLMVVDPIVPAAYSFDKVRDVFVNVGRMRLSSPTTKDTQIPTSDYISLDQTIFDVYDIVEGRNIFGDFGLNNTVENDREIEQETHERSDSHRFENASSCRDLMSIPKLKSEKTIYGSEKVHTRVLNAKSIYGSQQNPLRSNNRHVSTSMVHLNIHEDPEHDALSIKAILSNAILLVDMSNILGIVEYTFDIVRDVSFSMQRWHSSVDILHQDQGCSFLPSSLLQGKLLKISAKADGLGIGCQDPNYKGEDGRSKLFLYRINAGVCLCSNSNSESIVGEMNNPVVATYDLVRSSDDSAKGGIQKYKIMLRPSTLVADVADCCFGDFKYSLYKEKTTPPAIFSEEEMEDFKSRRKSTENIRKSFYEKEFKEGSDNAKLSNVLFRHVHFRTDPFVINFTEKELNILIHWLEHSIVAAREGSVELDLDISRVKSTANDLNTNASIEEFSNKLYKIFQAHNISGDEKIYSNMFRDLFLSEDVKASLLESEILNFESDFMLLLDPELKGYVTPNSISSRCKDICNKCGWDYRGNVTLQFSDFVGIRPASIFSDALCDGTALTNLWSLIEEQTPIRRGSGNLASIPSSIVQMILVRLCGDGALARALWERIIRKNLKDNNDILHPWLISDDHRICPVPTPGEIIRNKISETYHLAHHSEKSKEQSMLKQKVYLDTKALEDDVDISVTSFDIAAGTIQLNYLDTLLGPLLPRFQLSLSNMYFDGDFLHLGVVPDLSFTSNYSLISRLFGGVTLESCFFNSTVHSHEPIIEPFSLEFGAVNLPNDEMEFSIQIKDTDKLKLIVSSALLETLSTAIFCIIDNSNNRDEFFDRRSLSFSTLYRTDPCLASFIIVNRCGVDLSVQTFVNDVEDELEASDPLNTVTAAAEKVTPVSIPWPLMYRSYSESCFPEVLISTKEFRISKANQRFTSGSPVPVHSLAMSWLFLTKNDGRVG